MKKTIIKSICVFAVSLTLFNCNKDFLETSPTEFISVDDVGYTAQYNPVILEGTLNGIYSTMVNAFTGGTGTHEDFGQKGFDIFSDFLSGDMALTANNYNRYGAFVNLLATVDYTDGDNYMAWRYYYKIVRSSNLVIKSLGGNDAVPEKVENKWALGQAKALRAYAYFYLAQYYVKGYDASATILPLYDTSDLSVAAPVETSVIYDFIISDLTSAITLLDGFNRTGITPINQDVARGLLAYTYAAIGTSEANIEAKRLADQVIAAGYPIMSSSEVTGGFNSANTPGWVWGFDITLANDLDLVSWWGQMDVFTYSYQWAGDKKGIDSDLYASIDANDIRKTQFDVNNALQPRNKFYNANRVIGGQRYIEDDYVFMRISEMYLLSAEMAAKEGEDGLARTNLKEILSRRFSDPADYAYVDGLSGQALVDEIILQTRIELWGEGKSYLSMKRNKYNAKRGSNHVFHPNSSISYDDDRLSWVVPIQEVQNNPFIN
ncbi:RagB/SusD family nutrient uptake outer membrane protein [Tenacibaculum sp. 47A_GOM-205m]|uniref:RagB/SusD family nutrient uptake outer membrane protein n=1 Tax=Tenacibaculum sp. 47A_GOM-205m TaxID=1380384 RepID=UPI00048AA914|nr:RagB/SusD family nutrient uptake outer membrane protein [Tenacibaculum sp. 47A_GOM-205m]